MRRPAGITLDKAPLTKAFIAICFGVWLMQIMPGSQVTENYSLIAGEVLQEPYRLFTAMWLHAHFPVHIMVNMFALMILGSQAERAIGSKKFLLLYLAAGFVGNLAIWMSHPTLPAVGASGAIFGVLGFAAVWSRFNVSVVVTVLVNLMFGFLIPNIAWQAHMAGLVAGAALAFYWFTLPNLRKRKALSQNR